MPAGTRRDMNDCIIHLENIWRTYELGAGPVHALAEVSLEVHRNEYVAIVGPSGSGKSTLMNVIGCLDTPTQGVYRLGDRVVSEMGDDELARARNKEIGFVFQTFNLINRTTALDNVAIPLIYARVNNVRVPAAAALERVGLTARASHKPSELSGGERQRVAIARAIVNNPSLILADEPTGNLDTKTGNQIMDIFRQLHADGVTIVLVTHETYVAAQAERIIRMRDGKIVDDRQLDDDSRRKLIEQAA